MILKTVGAVVYGLQFPAETQEGDTPREIRNLRLVKKMGQVAIVLVLFQGSGMLLKFSTRKDLHVVQTCLPIDLA